MARSHSPHKSGYYLEQLCTVGACGALGAVTVLMWQMNKLDLILAKSFHGPVFWGGSGFLLLAIVRGISLWVEAGKVTQNGHHHTHDNHHHEHDEGPCEHKEE